MRKDHLQERLDVARANGDVTSEGEILRIIKRESEKTCYRRLHIFAGKPRSSPPISVTITDSDGAQSTIRTQEGFNEAVGAALSNRFVLAHQAPIMQNTLVEGIGMLGEGEAVQQNQ